MKTIHPISFAVSGLLLVCLFSVTLITCKQPANHSPGVTSPDSGGTLTDTQDGDTRIVIGIHDTPFKMQGKTVEKLNITIVRIDIITEAGEKITLLEEERRMDILEIAKSNPVVLSNVSIEPGTYSQLRFVLKDDSTIQVDGEVFDIKIPSGEQSGLKLNGPFVIPAGKLFRLNIDFVAARSVLWNKGQGYKLKPVLEISDTSEITGIFRGSMTVTDYVGENETLVQINSDNTARIRVSAFPNYTINCNYHYNSVTKQLKMTNISLDAPGLKKRALKKVMKEIPDEISLPVTEWSLNSVIAVDITGAVTNLYRVDSFDFSDGVSFTEFTLNVNYPDSSANGKDVVTEIRFIDTGMPPITLINTFTGDSVRESVQVLNSYIQGDSTRITITSYLFDDPDGLNIDGGTYASRPAVFMSGSYFSESSMNPWQEQPVYTLQRDGSQEFTVEFPQRLNIRMETDNFTNNHPVISWDSHSDADNGYFVLVLTKEKDIKYNNDSESGNSAWAVAWRERTEDTSSRVFSNKIKFIPWDVSGIPFTPGPSILPGDIIRIEVYVLDGTGKLDMKNRTGALFMDSLNIIR